MKHVLTSLSNLKSKVVKLDADEFVPLPVDLSKLNDIVKNDVVKKGVYDAKIKKTEDKIPHITNLATNTTINAHEVKKEMSIVNLATAVLNAKINEVKAKYLILLSYYYLSC